MNFFKRNFVDDKYYESLEKKKKSHFAVKIINQTFTDNDKSCACASTRLT